jgi:hypothetical protein
MNTSLPSFQPFPHYCHLDVVPRTAFFSCVLFCFLYVTDLSYCVIVMLYEIAMQKRKIK